MKNVYANSNEIITKHSTLLTARKESMLTSIVSESEVFKNNIIAVKYTGLLGSVKEDSISFI
jgi:hypothetical protein